MDLLSQSRKVASRILINNKMQQFKKQLQYSQKRFRHKSAHVRLADKVTQTQQKMYSQTPTKKKKSNSKNKSSEKNKSGIKKSHSPLKNKKLNSNSKGSLTSRSSSNSLSDSKLMMKGLKDRTHYLSELVTQNSSLILEKKQLEQRIAFYQKNIAIENRRYNQSQIKSKGYQDDIKQAYERLGKKQKQTKQVKQSSLKQRNQILIIKKELDGKIDDNNIIKLQIKKVKEEVKKAKNHIQHEHNQIRKKAVEKTQVKNILRESQKRLANQVVQKQELSDQKAHLMIEANQISKRIAHLSNK